MDKKLRVYGGDLKLEDLRELPSLNSAKGYLASKELQNAVNVALLLGKPLLITGEPGTGKTLLAKSIAEDLGLGVPLEFVAKTNSIARDLFYHYDSLRHFHDANKEKFLKKEAQSGSVGNLSKEEAIRKEYAPYINYVALGKAILLAQGKEVVQDILPKHEGPKRSVVLIDEIDKAPRDFPNDLLREIEHMELHIIETGEHLKAEDKYRPIVIITSNSERLLPDAFLRRCVYFHIGFPNEEQLLDIVKSRLLEHDPPLVQYDEDAIKWLITHFERVRKACRKKLPATAELLSWIQLLDQLEFDPSAKPYDTDLLLVSYSVLAKHAEDLKLLADDLTNLE